LYFVFASNQVNIKCTPSPPFSSRKQVFLFIEKFSLKLILTVTNSILNDAVIQDNNTFENI